MFKNILIGIFSAILVVAIGTAAYNLIDAKASGGLSQPAAVSNAGNGGNGNGSTNSVLNIPASDLNADETAGLLYMLEEEKLARDVYNALFNTWNVSTFQSIAASEQHHMDEVALLLDRYQIAYTTQAAGVFTNPELQNLYNALVAQGSQSLAEALKVGGAIEEIDILDLQSRISTTDNADIQQVYNNLMSGSYNHLNAFATALLNQTGETYQPQYLSASEYQAIIDGSAQNGNSYGNHGNASNGQGNSNRGGQGSNGTGTQQVLAQANLAVASTFHGTVSSYNYGTLTIQTDEGQVVGVQLGNQNFVNSLGFAPQIGEGVTVYGFPGDQGLFSAITVTLDNNGQVFAFRDANGRPLWSGGNGKGGGNH